MKVYDLKLTEEEADIICALIEQEIATSGSATIVLPNAKAALSVRHRLRTLQGKLDQPVVAYAERSYQP